MRKLNKAVGFCLFLLTMIMGANMAQAYDNEVYYAHSRYRWKIGGVEKGHATDLTVALQECIKNAGKNVTIHITCRGYLTGSVGLWPGQVLDFHNNDLNLLNDKTAFVCRLISDTTVQNLVLDGRNKSAWGMHLSQSDNLTLKNITVKNFKGIGMRIDSHPSKAFDYWSSGLTMRDCTFENLEGHGVETFGIKNFDIRNITARNCGECGVLINKGEDGWIDNVDAYRCCKGGGYAGLRFANDCADCKVGYVKAVECGRGFFTVSNIKNVTVEEVYIRDCTGHAILLQHSDGVGINGGSYNGEANNHYTSKNCWINATKVGGVPTGWVRIRNRTTGMYLDGYGRKSNGSDAALYANTTHYNAYWKLEQTGDYYYIVNRGTNMKLDSYGQTNNGAHCKQYSNVTTHKNAQWKLQKIGDYYFIINRGTNLKLDGYGQRTNGSACRLWENRTTHSNAQWEIK